MDQMLKTMKRTDMRRDDDVRRKRRPLIASILLCGMLALGACDSQGSASVEDLVKRAEQHRAEGNVRASLIELKNALQKDPNNARARLLLGQAFIDIGDAASAEIELQRARDLGAQTHEVALLLGETKLMRGQFDQVLSEFPVPDDAPAAAKAALLAMRGRAHMALGQRTQAEAAFLAGTRADPKQVDPWIGLARLALGERDRDRAQSYLARAVEAAAEDPKTLTLQADVAFAAGDYEASEKTYRKILKIRRDDVVALNAQLGIARAQIATGKHKDAIDRLTQVLKAAPGDPTTNYLRSLAAYQTKDYQEAKTHADLALRAAPNYRPAVFLAGAASYALGQYEQAFKHLTFFVSQVPDNVEGRKLLAATQLRMGQADKALGTLRTAVERGADDAQLLAMIGQASARAGDLGTASRYLEQAVARQPEDVGLRTQLGTTRVALGETSEGIEDLEKAAELDPKGNADVALILAHLRAKNYDKALEAAKRLQEKQPDNSNAYTLAGMAHIGKGDEGEAKASFGKALEINPADRNATKNLAVFAIRDKDFERARKYYKDALAKLPNDVEFLILLAQVEARAGQPREGLKYLEQAVEKNPDNLLARVALGRVYLLAGEANKALVTMQPAIDKNPTEPALLEVVGRAQMAIGQPESAISTFRTLVNQRPDVPQARQYLATAYENAGSIDRALGEIETALRFAPESPSARFQHARLLARAGKLDAAKTILGELKKAYASDPSVADLEGAVALASNRPTEAVAAYQRLLSVQENNFNLVKLVRAKLTAGLNQEAFADLEGWVKRFPEDAMVRTLYADVLLSRNQLAEAEAQYAEVVRLTPTNVAALNNLAWTMTKAGRVTDALAHARRAAQLAPENPAVLDTLGVTLTAGDNAKEAVQVLRSATQKAPQDPNIQVHLAQALAKDGKNAEARDILRKVLSGPNQPADRAEAEQLLKQVGG